MENRDENALPPWIWRVLGVAAVGLLLAAVGGIAFISAGVFDPQPLGELQDVVVPGTMEVRARERELDWLEGELPQTPFSVRLSAAHAAGETDVGYGLALGDAQAHVVVGVSPLGYVAIWQQVGGQAVDHMPWQTWPHVRMGGEPNEIQLDVVGRRLSVRLNRELLWEGPWEQSTSGLALYAESFGAATTIDFDEVAFYYEPIAARHPAGIGP